MQHINSKIKMTTLVTLIIFAIAAAMATTGCEFKNPFAKKSTGLAEPLPIENDDAEEFKGEYLTVKMDGYTSEKLKVEGHEQIWSVPEVSSTPAIMFKMDEFKLGAFKKVSITINPLINGKVNRQDIWQYAGTQPLTPGREIRLNMFNHIFDNNLISGVRQLPPGQYRLGLQANGEESWDRQYIDFEVR